MSLFERIKNENKENAINKYVREILEKNDKELKKLTEQYMISDEFRAAERARIANSEDEQVFEEYLENNSQLAKLRRDQLIEKAMETEGVPNGYKKSVRAKIENILVPPPDVKTYEKTTKERIDGYVAHIMKDCGEELQKKYNIFKLPFDEAVRNYRDVFCDLGLTYQEYEKNALLEKHKLIDEIPRIIYNKMKELNIPLFLRRKVYDACIKRLEYNRMHPNEQEPR